MIIQTRSGIMFNVLNPTVDMVNLNDIAWSLALVNRFNGHTKQPYSVAQHSVVMTDYLFKADHLWALMHDAAEAYIGDLAKPVKDLVPEFSVIESRVMAVIQERFGLTGEMPASVKEADRRMLVTEARDLMEDHTLFPAWGTVAPYIPKIYPWAWQDARKRWAERVVEILY